MITGPIKNIATASASGIAARARKNAELEATTSDALSR